MFSSRNELFSGGTWTPGWASGPVWTQKMLFSSRNELSLEETWTPGWSPGPFLNPKEAVLEQK